MESGLCPEIVEVGSGRRKETAGYKKHAAEPEDPTLKANTAAAIVEVIVHLCKLLGSFLSIKAQKKGLPFPEIALPSPISNIRQEIDIIPNLSQLCRRHRGRQ